jgi:hypothetical protein
LPSAREKVLGKDVFADVLFAEPSLPSVTLGKAFAECFYVFAECFRHSAKRLIPVVWPLTATVLRNASKNRFITVTIELICTSVIQLGQIMNHICVTLSKKLKFINWSSLLMNASMAAWPRGIVAASSEGTKMSIHFIGLYRFISQPQNI